MSELPLNSFMIRLSFNIAGKGKPASIFEILRLATGQRCHQVLQFRGAGGRIILVLGGCVGHVFA